MTRKSVFGSPLFWERFWAKVEVTPTCYVWRGSRRRQDYGAMMVDQKEWAVHRLAWTAINGPIPDGIDVLHRCDNPPCVRIDHLFLGTHLDNMRDMMKKGRYRPPPTENSSRGVDHFRAKLSDERVRILRDGISAGQSQAYFARLWSIDASTIHSAAHRKTWRHIE